MATSSFHELTKKLHEKSKELDSHLTKLKKANNDLRDSSTQVLTTLGALVGNVAPRQTCNVCYSRPRECCLLPCGHAGLCLSCGARAQTRGRCFVCRQPIEDVMRIYLS